MKLPLALLAVALVIAPAPVPEKPKTDKERLQGVWVVNAVEVNGESAKEGPIPEYLLNVKLTFKDDSVLNSAQPTDKGAFSIDPDKKPPTFDLIVRGENDQIKGTELMLYELKNDALRLCGMPNRATSRPKEFNSKDGQIIITLKREEKKPEK